VKRLLVVLAALALIAVPVSNANFNARTSNTLSVELRSTSEFLKLLSDAADDAGERSAPPNEDRTLA